MQFIVIARDAQDADAKSRRARVRPAHLESIDPFVKRGAILVGGAILDEAGEMIGSTLLVDFASHEELDAWLRNDPYVTGEVWHEVEIHPFRAAVGSWMPPS